MKKMAISRNLFRGKDPLPSLGSRSLSALPKHSLEFTKTPRNVSKDKAKSVGKQINLFETIDRKLTWKSVDIGVKHTWL